LVSVPGSGADLVSVAASASAADLVVAVLRVAEHSVAERAASQVVHADSQAARLAVMRVVELEALHRRHAADSAAVAEHAVDSVAAAEPVVAAAAMAAAADTGNTSVSAV
jgi:hypothetical protein